MAIVKGPFFSTYASGSIAKTITSQPLHKNNKHIMKIYKRSAGKRHQIQIDNQNIFRDRQFMYKKFKKDGK